MCISLLYCISSDAASQWLISKTAEDVQRNPFATTTSSGKTVVQMVYRLVKLRCSNLTVGFNEIKPRSFLRSWRGRVYAVHAIKVTSRTTKSTRDQPTKNVRPRCRGSGCGGSPYLRPPPSRSRENPGGVFFTRVLLESSVKRVTCAHAALLYGHTLWFSKSFLRYRSTAIAATAAVVVTVVLAPSKKPKHSCKMLRELLQKKILY